MKKGAYELPPFHPNCRGTIVPVREEVEKKELFEERTNYLAKKHGIEGGNMLSKMKRLNKLVEKGKGYQTPEEKEIYRLKEDYLLDKIRKSGQAIRDNGQDTTYKISQGRVQVNRHVSNKVKRILKKEGLLK